MVRHFPPEPVARTRTACCPGPLDSGTVAWCVHGVIRFPDVTCQITILSSKLGHGGGELEPQVIIYLNDSVWDLWNQSCVHLYSSRGHNKQTNSSSISIFTILKWLSTRSLQMVRWLLTCEMYFSIFAVIIQHLKQLKLLFSFPIDGFLSHSFLFCNILSFFKGCPSNISNTKEILQNNK